MKETLSQYKSRVAMEDDAMSRGFRHDQEVQAGRVEFIVEAPSWGAVSYTHLTLPTTERV